MNKQPEPIHLADYRLRSGGGTTNDPIGAFAAASVTRNEFSFVETSLLVRNTVCWT